MVGDVPFVLFGAHPPGYCEFQSKRYLLAQLICACKVLWGRGGRKSRRKGEEEGMGGERRGEEKGEGQGGRRKRKRGRGRK